MNSIICTLFENEYHYGLAGLVNSLKHNGFKGKIFAGYKGNLPEWSAKAEKNNDFNWEGSVVYSVEEDIKIYFLPIDTKLHLANFKPYFLLSLIKFLGSNDSGIIYFDPDIVIKCNWAFYENWISHGVALVHEIISNDMPESHPIRQEWKKVIVKANMEQKRQVASYINSGFCGIARPNFEFINVWAKIMDTGIQHFDLGAESFDHKVNRTNPFFAKDQDAFNIAAMCCESPISELGPEGMDFIHGGFTMSHAVGSPKPWKKNFILSALNGGTPSLADKAYWTNVNSAIITDSTVRLTRKKLALRLASVIGRFYRRY